MLDNLSDIVAISSLESPHHSENKVPNIVSICWSLGKRCNYDCSYCGADIHDNFSPHLPLKNIKNFTKKLNNHYLKLDKKIKYSITGGEPYVHPKILEILKYISKLSQTEAIVVVTNGSLPDRLYRDSFRYITNLTISLHLERKDSETYDTLNKILRLNTKNVFLVVNLMALPGKFKLLEEIMGVLDHWNIKYVLRSINPRIDYKMNIIQPNESGMARDVTNKEEYSFFYDRNRKNLKEQYYNKEELDFLENHINDDWENIRVWDSRNKNISTNSDELHDKDLNHFMGWICYAGIDSLYIDVDGKVYRSWCHNDGSIGHINDIQEFVTEPTICKKQCCSCNTDIVIRKCKNKDNLSIIS